MTRQPSLGPPIRAWDAKHLRIATDAAGVALWPWNANTDKIDMDDLGFGLLGVPKRADVIFAHLSSHIHPADRDHAADGQGSPRHLTRRMD